MSAIIGKILDLPQEKGPEVELLVSGDEFYTRYENLDGYTAVYDASLGLFTYAILVNGEMASSGVSISEPTPQGLKRHLREDPAVRYDKSKLKHARMIPARTRGINEGSRTFGQQKGLLKGRLLHKGQIKGLTVLVQFPDKKIDVTPSDVSEMLNGINYNKNGNFCSVREYFLKMSCGRLDYTNEVVGPITLSKERMHYHFYLLVEEAMNAVVDMGVDLSKFDSEKIGIIDALSFLYAGGPVPDGELHPHNSSIDLKFGNISTYMYMLSNLGTSTEDLAIGTICHETGHLLCRFPDLYDYGYRDNDNLESWGMGLYCLMSLGDRLDNHKTPSPVCAYLRDLAKWCDNAIDLNKAGKYEAKGGDYGSVMKFKTDRENEYFLVENRSQIGLDKGLPCGGLAVYHCDIFGSNEWQEGSPSKHYQCALLQRDGQQHLERGLNYGDGNDLYRKANGVVLSYSTNPSSMIWDRSESGLIISDISDPGEVMSFAVGQLASEDTVRVEASPALEIPDNDKNGVSCSLNISEDGNAASIWVSVDISHTFISDLKVELLSPSGQRAIIHDRDGGSETNLVKTFDSKSNLALAALAGLPIKGQWSLLVADVAAQDKGVLNRWGMEIEKVASPKVFKKDLSPNKTIPDSDPTGVSEAIKIDKKGIVQRIVTRVDITHPYIADLRVELTSPSGGRAILHDKGGFGLDNLVKTYDSETNAELGALKGEPLDGSWILRVMDVADQDEGKLNKWTLEVIYSG